MKNMIKKVSNKVNEMVIKAKNAIDNKKGEGYIDSGVKIIIAVVIGVLLLGLLYTLFTTVVEPTLTSKVTALFNYSGT